MLFELTPDLRALKEKDKKIAQEKIKPIASETEKKGMYSDAVIKKMGKLGFLGMIIPQEYGGQGLGYLPYMVVLEEIAKADASHSSVMALHNSLFAFPVINYGTEEQKKKYLPKICTAEKYCAFALSEPDAGSDATAIQTTATKVGADYLINGTKIFVTNGSVADFVLVYAVTEKGKKAHGITVFLVEKETPGFQVGTIEKKMGFKGSPTCELIFQDVKVPESAVLGKLNEGFKIAMDTLNGGRISIGAMAVGIAQAAFEEAFAYAQKRIQFGKPLCEFQAIQFMLSDMATQIESARQLTYYAAWLKDNHLPHIKESAQAKLFATEMATKVCYIALQIFGGYGYMENFNLSRFYRDARVTEIFEGTSEMQRLTIARSLLKD